MTTEDFIRKAKETHGELYDYTDTIFEGYRKPVFVKCKRCGTIFRTDYEHHIRRKQGCPCMAKNKTLSLTESIKLAVERHKGETYDYGLVSYEKMSDKVTIICLKHGPFKQQWNLHLKGCGCPKCKHDEIVKKRKMTYEEFVKCAEEKHKGKNYQYIKDSWTNLSSNIDYICPIHGKITQKASTHISGKNGNGCPKCAIDKRKNTVKSKRLPFSEANSLIKTFGFTTYQEYLEKYNEFLKPLRFPKCPQSAYKNEGWNGMRNFLGNQRDPNFFKKYEEAQKFASSLGLKSMSEWITFCQDGKCPTDIPKHPNSYYKDKGWKNWGEWLGYGLYHNNADRVYFSYSEFKEYMQPFRFTSKDEYDEAIKKKILSLKCPAQPSHKYKEEWEGWPEVLGYDRKIRKIENTNNFVKLSIEVHGDKYDYSKVDYKGLREKVCIICPEHGEFWQTPDVHLRGCGCPNCVGFTREYKLSLLKLEDLAYMTPHQLIEIIASKKLPNEFRVLATTPPNTESRIGSIRALRELFSEESKTEEEIKAEIEEITEEAEHKIENSDTTIEDIRGGLFNPNEVKESEEPEATLPIISVLSEAHVYDDLIHMKPSDEGAKFIILDETHRLWNSVLVANENNTLDEAIEKIKNEEGGEFWKYIQNTFISEYETVNTIDVDSDYRFPYKPSLMQKFMAYNMMNNNSYGNWCGTGAGKTNAFLFSTRKTNSKVTVAIVPNDVIETLSRAIDKIYPNSDIYIPKSVDEIPICDTNKFSYIIYNYHKFQGNNGAEDTINTLLEKNKIDFICLDEVQNAKVSDTKNASDRSQFIADLIVRGRELNPNMKTLAMSATPCINNLQEVRSIVELLTGVQHEEIGNRNTIANIHAAYKALLINGFRYVPKYNIEITERTIEIDHTNDEQLYNVLINQDKGDIPNIEYILALRKLDSVKNEIKAGTIVYATWVSGMAEMLVENIKSWGYTAESYNGESGDKNGRKEVLDRFLNGKTDVLVCSKPISTGVDGLQKKCNKMIIVSLPWTDADYTQLKGRIYRQGSVFNVVEFVIPQIVITTPNGDEWSWDKMRKQAIDNKRSLGTAVLDGFIQESYTINKDMLLTKAIEALENGLEDAVVVRKPLDVSVFYSATERRYSESYINNVHRLANSSNSSTTHERYQNNRGEFEEYHRLREIAKTHWIEDPIDRVAELIKGMSSRYTRIVDMGCGMNKLKTVVDGIRTVQGIDHINISGDDTVIEADMSDLNSVIEDNSIDVAVFCLSLWGTNYRDYFTEAYRILDSDGKVIIVEPSSKFGEHERYNTIDVFVDDVESYGFERIGKVETRNNFVYFKFQKI